MPRLLGSTIRVSVLDPTSIVTGREYVFAATPTQWGSDVLVAELGHEPASGAAVLDGSVQQVVHARSTGTGATRTTAFFKVSQAWSGQAPGAALSGKVIKVELDGVPVVKNEHLTVYTSDAPINLNLVHADITTPAQELGLWNEVQTARQEQLEKLVQESVSRATLVFEGLVVNVTTGSPEAACSSGLLNNPQLGMATLRVVKAYKGAIRATDTLSADFVQSDDVRWAGAPKVKKGQRSIFFLSPASAIGCVGSTQLGVYRKDDVLNASNARYVEEAVRSQ